MKNKILTKLSATALALAMGITGVGAVGAPDKVLAADNTFNETENNHSYDSADTISVNGAQTIDVKGHSKGYKEEDFFKIDFATAGNFTAKGISDDGTMSITFYDSDRKILKVPENGYCHKANDYIYMEVVCYTPVVGTSYKEVGYIVSLAEDESAVYEQENNDTPSNANELTNGVTTKGHIEALNEDDYYKLVVPKGQYAVVNFTIDGGVIFDYGYSTKIATASNSDYVTNINSDRNLTFKGSEKWYEGTYYIDLSWYLGDCYSTFYNITPTLYDYQAETPAVSTKGGKLSLKWNKNNENTGYEISYSAKKNFKGSKKVKINNSKKSKATIKNLKAGRKYYVKMRSYVTVGKDKCYSNWSQVKSVKIKK